MYFMSFSVEPGESTHVRRRPVRDSGDRGPRGLEERFDLLILDVMLPFRSGLDLCRDIRQAGLATPILFLTARNETVDKVVGFKLGGDDYVTKPFEAAELLAKEGVSCRVL